jgi:uncharacterized membrane protein
MTTASLSGKRDPVVRQIAARDVVEALVLGLRDFQRVPTHGLVLGALCAAIGMSFFWMLFAAGVPYFAYPLAAGFAIVCPFLAAGLYEVSRRLERGEEVGSIAANWRAAAGRGEVRWMGFVTLFVLIIWMYQVRLLMAIFLGYTAMDPTLNDVIRVLLTTNEGLTFLAVGNVVGAILATILFSITVISFPLILDRDVDVVTAIVTSVRAVSLNPVPMLLWAAIIVALLVVATLPLFAGLLVALPVLGHATWHLYRRLVEPDPTAVRGVEPTSEAVAQT